MRNYCKRPKPILKSNLSSSGRRSNGQETRKMHEPLDNHLSNCGFYQTFGTSEVTARGSSTCQSHIASQTSSSLVSCRAGLGSGINRSKCFLGRSRSLGIESSGFMLQGLCARNVHIDRAQLR
jgi:hypothetical protein